MIKKYINMDSILSPEENWDDKKDNTPKRVFGKTGLVKNIVYLLILVLMIGGTIYGIKTRPEILGLSKNSAEDNSKLVNKYTKEIGEIILLPEEIPTLATVTDLSKVSSQPFFKNAKEGDIVLVYAASKKAYLYRPEEKKIIEVGVVNANSPEGKVAGESANNIQVISPTPLPTSLPTTTSTPIPTKAPIVITKPLSPTPTIEIPPQQ
jgi:hypothetical protein